MTNNRNTISGKDAQIRIHTEPFINFTDGVRIDGVNSSDFTDGAELIEVNNFGNTFKKRAVGLFDSTIELSGNFLPKDEGQLLLKSGTYVYILYISSNSTVGLTGEYIVGSKSYNATAEGLQEFSVTLEGNSAVEELFADD